MQPRRPGLWGALSGGALLALVWLLAARYWPARGDDSRLPAGSRAVSLRWVTFEGACDASGAVPVDERHFAVADDEDNVIRIYDAVAGGKPVRRSNLSKQLALDRKGAESDIEAATHLNGHAFWLSSHGRNSQGEVDPNRSLLITTDLPALDSKLEVRGRVYRELLADLEQSPSLRGYDLEHAAELAPKAPGGLNLEGLTATPEGTLLIGFRNPIPREKALIVPVLNPEALEQESGRLVFGAPLELDLGGLGVRSLSFWRGSYLIAAGPAGEEGPVRLYRWPGPGSAPSLAAEAVFEDTHPEAFFTAESNDEILVLSDDGGRQIRGTPCKKLDQKKHKRFRGLWLRLPDARS